MQTAISQAIGLTLHGNAFLETGAIDSYKHFWPGSNEFKFCEFIRFVDISQEGQDISDNLLAADPPSWFKYLRKRGIERLNFIPAPMAMKPGQNAPPARMLVGFTNSGGRWLIEATHPGGTDYWEGKWRIGDDKREDRNIWQVFYFRLPSERKSTFQPDNPQIVRERLQNSLHAIHGFAEKHGLDNFAPCFERGVQALGASTPLPATYRGAVTPELNLSLQALQVWGAVMAGWVFGTMGSWNDVSFSGTDQEEYEAVSEEHYQALLQAAALVANWNMRQGKPVSKLGDWAARLIGRRD